MGKIREEMEKVVRENAIKDLKELQIDIGSSPDDLDNSPLYYALDIAIKALKQPCEDCIRELIREFDNKHPALFADYMQEFNNHPISEIIDYMWDMHCLIEDIRYRLPNEGGEEE